jgi:hypothetical protein
VTGLVFCSLQSLVCAIDCHSGPDWTYLRDSATRPLPLIAFTARPAKSSIASMLARTCRNIARPLAGNLLVPAVQKLSLVSQGEADSSGSGGGSGEKHSEVAMVSG